MTHDDSVGGAIGVHYSPAPPVLPEPARARGRRVTLCPSPDLAPYVRRYFICDLTTANDEQIPASGKSFMLLHFGDVVLAQIRDRKLMPGPALVAGPPSQPFTVRCIGRQLRFFAVEFTAIGQFALFGDVTSALANSVEPVETLLPSAKHRSLTDALTCLTEPDDKRREVESFLRTLLPRRLPQSVERTSHFASLAARTPGRPVNELAREVGVSGAFLRRALRQVAGISPKALAESERMAAAFTTIYDEPRARIAELATDLGYHDQAHFSRAFKKYTGDAPGRLQRERFRLARTMMLQPGLGY